MTPRVSQMPQIKRLTPYKPPSIPKRLGRGTQLQPLFKKPKVLPRLKKPVDRELEGIKERIKDLNLVEIINGEQEMKESV